MAPINSYGGGRHRCYWLLAAGWCGGVILFPRFLVQIARTARFPRIWWWILVKLILVDFGDTGTTVISFFTMAFLVDDEVDFGASARNLHHKAALETADLQQRAHTVRAEFRELGRRRLALQEEWRRLRIERTYLEDERRRFEDVRCSPWFQAHALPTAKARRIKLNVGGQLFETTASTLLRDPDSMLAAMAGPEGPLMANDGCFYIDRDWWLFRHILTFLRDGKLPSRRRLLSQLYCEADFYNLVLLRRAVRERLDPGYQIERTARVPLGAVDEIVRSVPPPPARAPLVMGNTSLRRSLDDFDTAVGERARRWRGWREATRCHDSGANRVYWRRPLSGGANW